MVRRILLAVEIRDLLLALRQRQRREVHRVGTHVGDETLLVEVLRDGHGLRNRHPQLAPRLLLQRGGREGRRGIALHGLLLDLGHREGRADAAAEERLGLLARLEARRQLGLEERPILVPGGMELRHDAEIGVDRKAMISRSRSTSSRTATLCTRPADSDGRTFFHSTGDSSKPTRRSSTRRACWALTRFMSTVRGFSIASKWPAS